MDFPPLTKREDDISFFISQPVFPPLSKSNGKRKAHIFSKVCIFSGENILEAKIFFKIQICNELNFKCIDRSNPEPFGVPSGEPAL